MGEGNKEKQKEKYAINSHAKDRADASVAGNLSAGETRKEEGHLPLFGVGPVYAATLALCTALSFFARKAPFLSAGRIDVGAGFFYVLGGVLVLLGVFLWVQAVLIARLDDHILVGELVTSGVYAWVRNPIYAAILLVCTGALIVMRNLYLLILPILYWAYLTVLMKHTEEKWLLQKFGSAYEEYCMRVNRCIPWPPKKG